VVGGLVLFAYLPYLQGFIFFSPIAALALMAGFTFIWKRFAPKPVLESSSRVLTFLGNHSLEIFLLHQPLIREYNYYLHGRWFNIPTPTPGSLMVGMAIGITVTLLVSVELRQLIARFLPREKSPV
jgi:peptidoglycan/LPS O-acetylase OafA/YrhL